MFVSVSGGNRDSYNKTIQNLRHNVHETALFDDKNLALAIDAHDPDDMDICTNGSFSVCERGNVSSHDLIEAVKSGRLWINLRHIHKSSAPHGTLVNEMHKKFEKQMGITSSTQVGGLLISSPRAKVGYHFDLTDVTLWHLRGRKRIYIYPKENAYIAPKEIQRVALEAGIEAIPYEPHFDEGAEYFDLMPGDLITWPHMSPHRIDNLEGLNVSLSLESLTMQSRLQLGSHYLDGVMNNVFGTDIETEKTAMPVALTKTVISTLIKKAKFKPSDFEPVKPTYRLNLDNPNCVEAI